MEFNDGSRVLELRYDGYELVKGKQKLTGLPATYVEEASEADTVNIILRDTVKSIKVILQYTAYSSLDVITRNVKVVNESSESVRIDRIMSMNVDFEDSEYDMIELSGAWGRERHIERMPLRSGIQSIESRRGASSHQLNPFFCSGRKKYR